MEKKTIIEITRDSGCKITICDEDGTKKNKRVPYHKMLQMLNAASSDEYEERFSQESALTDILPGDDKISTIQVKEMLSSKAKWYILLREGVSTDVKLYDKTYKKVAMPRTIYAVKVANGRCASLRICCIKDRFITENTKIYRYPYSNVFDTRSVCLGGNRLNDFDLGTINNVVMIPEMFLAMTNNHDGYRGSNDSGFEYDELLELFSESTFDESILRESANTRTYLEFINSLH